jgi:4-amino-4-deoxy-L-arabinose transferase-like glycosyltransferase
LVVRVAGLVRFGPVVSKDTEDYTIPAINIASGDDYFTGLDKRDVLRTPGYPLLLAGVYAVAGEDNFVVALLQQILVVLAGIFVFLVGRKVIGESPALIGAGIFLFNPYMLIFPNFILSEPISIVTLSTLLLLLILAMEKEQPFYFFASGLLLGYHILCRPPEQLLPLVILVPLWMKYRSFKRVFRFFLLVVLGVVLIILPWLWYNYAKTGNIGFTPLLGRNLALKVAHHTALTLDLPASVEVDSVIEKRGNVWEPSNEMMAAGCSREEVDQIYLQGALGVIKKRPFSFLLWQVQELWEFWRGYDLQGFVRLPRIGHLFVTSGVGLVMLILFLLGLFRLRVNSSSVLLLLTIAYFALLVPLAAFGSTRFRFPVEPYIWIYVANGLLLILSSLRKRLE